MNKKLGIYIIFLFLIIPSALAAKETQLLCLSEGETVQFSKCNPLIQDRTCDATSCQYCVTFDSSTGVYCNAALSVCNSLSGVVCSDLIESEIEVPNNPEENPSDTTEENNTSVPSTKIAHIAYILKD